MTSYVFENKEELAKHFRETASKIRSKIKSTSNKNEIYKIQLEASGYEMCAHLIENVFLKDISTIKT